MTCVVKLTDRAKCDLRQIALHITEQTGDKSVAINFIRELQEKVQIIQTFPKSGAIPKDRILKSHGYRFLVHKDYLIFYLYQEDEHIAYVTAVFHGSRDYMRMIKNIM